MHPTGTRARPRAARASRADEPLHVLLCTEGTYPYSGGGVSTWCDTLVRALDDVRFSIWAVTGSAEAAMIYEQPANVTDLHTVPLWGVSERAELRPNGGTLRRVLAQKRATTPREVEERFLPLLARLLDALEREAGPVGRLDLGEARATGAVLHGLWRYFQEFDWNRTWRHPETWSQLATRLPSVAALRDDAAASVSVDDLTIAAQWLQHFLTPLAAPVPKVDVVHSTIAGFAGIAGIVAWHEHGTPMVLTEHGVYLRERHIAVAHEPISLFKKRFLTRLSAVMSRLAYGHATEILPVADFNRRWELQLGAEPHRIRTVRNGIDADRFVPGPKPPHLRDRPVVVAAARVFPLKDIETMIRAAAHVRRAIPDVLFLVYGDTDADPAYAAGCHALIDVLDLRGHFRLCGLHPDPSQLYNEGDVSVLTSISEGFPFTVIESMSCERPVVATDVGGVAEALHGCGRLVPPKDHRAVASALVELLNDAAGRLALGTRARAVVLDRYRTHHSTDAYRDVYERLAGQSSKVRATRTDLP